MISFSGWFLFSYINSEFRILASDLKPGTDQAHAELCYAICLLADAILTMVQDPSFMSFIHGALKFRSCYMAFKWVLYEASSSIRCQWRKWSWCISNFSQIHKFHKFKRVHRPPEAARLAGERREGALRERCHMWHRCLQLGELNRQLIHCHYSLFTSDAPRSGTIEHRNWIHPLLQIISSLPQKVLNLLEFIGFHGDEATGEQLLVQQAEKFEGFMAFFSCIALLVHQSYLHYIFGENASSIFLMQCSGNDQCGNRYYLRPSLPK